MVKRAFDWVRARWLDIAFVIAFVTLLAWASSRACTPSRESPGVVEGDTQRVDVDRNAAELDALDTQIERNARDLRALPPPPSKAREIADHYNRLRNR